MGCTELLKSGEHGGGKVISTRIGSIPGKKSDNEHIHGKAPQLG